MQIEISDTIVMVAVPVLILCWLCVGADRIGGLWFAIQENRRRKREEVRRDREEERRDGDVVRHEHEEARRDRNDREARRSWLGPRTKGRVEVAEKKADDV